MNSYLKIVICLLFGTLCLNAEAQRTQKVRGEYTYYPPESLSLEVAKKTAIERARLEALAKEFGSLVTQATSSWVENEGQSSDVRFLAVGGTQTKGEWISDIDEPKLDIRYLNNMLAITAKVYGRARELKSPKEKVFTSRILRNGTDDRDVSEKFYVNDQFFLSFETPIDGYLAVYLIDEHHNANCLLPYQADKDGKEEVEHGKRHVFFSEDHVSQELKKVVNEYTLTCERSVEQNIIYVIFSPNPFIKAVDRAVEHESLRLPNQLPLGDFMKWLDKNRLKDVDMQVDIHNITIHQK